MKKSVWDKVAPFYKLSVRKDKRAYKKVYRRIAKVVKDKRVLELATGPGLIAKNIAYSARSVVATDFSKEMIKQAKKGVYPDNLIFQVADAMDISFEDNSFDVVIIANALHIVPDAEAVLKEIKRVLKDDGLLIAPNYLDHYKRTSNSLWIKLLEIVGVSFVNTWSGDEYRCFIENYGFIVTAFGVIQARIPMAYLECKQNIY